MANMYKTNPSIEQRAKKVHSYRKLKKIIPISLAALFAFLMIIYVVSLMYTRFGSFTVSINKYHQLQYGLSLSETEDFKKPTSMLNCKASEVITNIDGASLDEIDLGSVDGVDNGSNYLCYSFYCRNSGQETITFEYSIIIANMTLNIEKAVRVRLISSINKTNAQKVDYARAAGVDDNGNVIPEPNTTPFYTKNTIVQKSISDFAPMDTMRFTVVIWLEGNDPECIDDIIGGEFKIDMKFSIMGVSGSEE